jgi:hypothetical protein
MQILVYILNHLILITHPILSFFKVSFIIFISMLDIIDLAENSFMVIMTTV